MSLSNKERKTTKIRGSLNTQERRFNIINTILHSEDPLSQNQIFQNLKDSTNWATLRRDLDHLKKEGFISTKKGIRNAINHEIRFKGLITYLSKIENPLTKSYIGKIGEEI